MDNKATDALVTPPPYARLQGVRHVSGSFLRPSVRITRIRAKGVIVCALILAMFSCGQERGNVEVLNSCATEWSGLIGDGNCDPILNNEDCGYDGGDCCECTCVDGTGYSCGYSGFNCLDRNATACPGELMGQYADCEGDLAFFGDGSCDHENNNEVGAVGRKTSSSRNINSNNTLLV